MYPVYVGLQYGTANIVDVGAVLKMKKFVSSA